MRTTLIIAALGAVIAALFGGIRIWSGLAGVEMPWQGWLALALGVIFTLALGIGLMALVFYSARHGHDEAHHMRQSGLEPEEEESKRSSVREELRDDPAHRQS
ncbi:MAG TPA: hypothetical protein VK035_06960 [Kiloniellales bacterium]|nr:hypothetical protein [Kiloniellales bacterium]